MFMLIRASLVVGLALVTLNIIQCSSLWYSSVVNLIELLYELCKCDCSLAFDSWWHVGKLSIDSSHVGTQGNSPCVGPLLSSFLAMQAALGSAERRNVCLLLKRLVTISPMLLCIGYSTNWQHAKESKFFQEDAQESSYGRRDRKVGEVVRD